jgi:hypothetical protein
MGRQGNYKKRGPIDDQDRRRDTRAGFAAYFSKPEHACDFHCSFHMKNTLENINKAFDDIKRLEKELEVIWEKSLID